VRTEESGRVARGAGVLGLSAALTGIVAAFLPTQDVDSVLVFELKMVLGVVGPTAFGWFLYRRTRRAQAAVLEGSMAR
jgi:hypothetical protein